MASLGEKVAVLEEQVAVIHKKIERMYVKMECVGRIEQKLFDKDIGIITNYLEHKKAQKKIHRDLWIGVILTIVSIIAAGCIR